MRPMKCGLNFNTANINQLAWGIQRKSSPFSYVEPNIRGDLHNSLSGAWWLLEYLPKSAKYKEWPARTAHFGYYIPDAEPRLIPEGAVIHESAIERMNAMPSYRPVNMPAKYETFPMPVPPGHGASAEDGGKGVGWAKLRVARGAFPTRRRMVGPTLEPSASGARFARPG